MPRRRHPNFADDLSPRPSARQVISADRNSNWTITPVFQHGKIIAVQLILRKKLEVRTMQHILDPSAGHCPPNLYQKIWVSKTENSIQGDDTMVDFCTFWLSKTDFTRAKPGRCVMDAHYSHLQRRLVELFAHHHCFLVMEQSQQSHRTQVGDLGPNKAIGEKYNALYGTHVAFQQFIDGTHARVLMLLRVLSDVAADSAMIQTAWRSSGTLYESGVATILQHYSPAFFTRGSSFAPCATGCPP